MWFKKLVWFLLFSVLSGTAMAQENPYKILQDVASITFERIKNEQAQIQQDPEILKVIVEEELLPYVDYKFAGAKVLGKYFKSVPREQIPLFFEEFRKYLIATYAVALAQYEDQDVLFEPEKDFSGKKAVTVRAVIKDDERPDIKIAFKVRRSSKTKEWKAYDMVAEGISVLSSKRSEFESVLRQEGIDKVIAIMQEKNAQKISVKKDA
ncbi:phospholipid-binding protein MlaC [Planctobacterium marinum]